MAKRLTALFNSVEAALNAHEDLIDTGFPSENVYLDREMALVMVLASEANEPEFRALLRRHQPASIIETPARRAA